MADAQADKAADVASRFGFGFEVLLTFMLPGIAVALAVLILLLPQPFDVGTAKELLEIAGKAQFFSVFVFIAAITLFGAMVASVHSFIETLLLDKCITPWMAGQTPKEFQEAWDHYISILPSNRYISRVVFFFLFETRLGIALIF